MNDPDLHETRPRAPALRWREAESGRHYCGARWSSERRRRRDPRLVAAALDGRIPPGARILDAPCGTGRLREAIEQRGAWIGLDASPAMLAEIGRPGRAVHGDAFHLPFRDGAFDAVVSCRFLHHLRERAVLERALAELVRVSSRWIVASFWDAGSLPAWRRRRRPLRPDRSRVAIPKAELAEAFRAAGARVVDWRHSFRFLSQQVFAVAEKEAVHGRKRRA